MNLLRDIDDEKLENEKRAQAIEHTFATEQCTALDVTEDVSLNIKNFLSQLLDINKFSTFYKLLHKKGRVKKFINNSKPGSFKLNRPIYALELEESAVLDTLHSNEPI